MYSKGVGNKTFDYFKMLVGLKTVAIDRHLEKFCNRADIKLTNYTEYHQLIMDTATILDVEPQVLDHSIWRYMSDQQNKTKKVTQGKDSCL